MMAQMYQQKKKIIKGWGCRISLKFFFPLFATRMREYNIVNLQRIDSWHLFLFLNGPKIHYMPWESFWAVFRKSSLLSTSSHLYNHSES